VRLMLLAWSGANIAAYLSRESFAGIGSLACGQNGWCTPCSLANHQDTFSKWESWPKLCDDSATFNWQRRILNITIASYLEAAQGDR
jgi:hypothetical protein